MPEVDSFPRQAARTRRFTLGAPRSFSVAADGRRVLFLRSPGPEDPLTALWSFEVGTATERQVAGPDQAAGELTAEEQARRERARESASGIVTYATDRDHKQAVYALGGELWVCDVDSATTRRLAVSDGVFDPRLDPTGRHIAYCAAGALRVVNVDGSGDRELVGEPAPEVTWGQAEFVAAEEMGRDRGFWWAPDGTSLLVARVDNSAVPIWWIADPVHPDRAPRPHRYPAAGTTDAEVTLWQVGLDGTRTSVEWDHDRFPYLFRVVWTDAGPPLMVVEARDHRSRQLIELDSGRVIRDDHDEDWLEAVPGTPAWLGDGRLVDVMPDHGTYRLTIGGEAVTPRGLQVRAVLDVDDTVLFSASNEPTEVDVWRWAPEAGLRPITSGGVATATAGGPTLVTMRRDLTYPGAVCVVGSAGKTVAATEIVSHAAKPMVEPRIEWVAAGDRQLRTGVLLPTNPVEGASYPVVLAPYGGPGHQAAMASQSLWLEAQWLADQGFAVVIADGRGTPGRGPDWERAIQGDFATLILEDQVTALRAAAEAIPALDATRVGIRGWSFGGYLSALAVLRRPDVFHAAVAGAPPTDWRLYDTYYTEKFLGHPDIDPEAYRRSSLLDDAAKLERPLLIIHGLVDDNVVVAHSLRLSQALLEAGRPHNVLPLSGVTHMTSQEEVAENLLLLQVDFLRRHLGGPVASVE